MDASLLSVGRGATHRGGCRIDTPKKRQGPRVVVVPPHVRPALEAAPGRPHVGPGPEALLFPRARGGCHLNDQVFRQYFVAAM